MAIPQRADAAAEERLRRRRRGAFATPHDLVRRVVEAVMPPIVAGQRVTVLDPACGDGRFLAAAADHIAAAGGVADLHGVDIDPAAMAITGAALDRHGAVRIEVGDALARDWDGVTYDVVLGNPPFLSQLASVTTRGGASVHGGGPYADTAAEFLAMSVALAKPGVGRVGLVLPQSILGSRDTGPVRAIVERLAEPIWSWWSPRRHFDAASVFVCALGFRRRPPGNQHGAGGDTDPVWTSVVTRAIGIPDLPPLEVAGTVGDRAVVTADFRDQYYGLVPGVGDHDTGPRLITSGVIDPGRCRWGERPVTFCRQRLERPRVDVSRLAESMRRWARRMAVPKLLIANQTRVVECVVDIDGTMLPVVPVLTARPLADPDGVNRLLELAAVVSSPLASAALWHAAAGTGLSASTIRLRPALVSGLTWPAGSLDSAADAFADGDLEASAAAVHRAYGIAADQSERLTTWWRARCPRERARGAA